MSILLLLNGMVKVFLSLHDKHSMPLRLRAIMRIKKETGSKMQDVYNSQYGNLKYIVSHYFHRNRNAVIILFEILVLNISTFY